MKTKLVSKVITMLLIVLCISISNAFSQSWDKTKPNIIFATDKQGNVSSVKVGVGTSTPQFSLEVKGKINSL